MSLGAIQFGGLASGLDTSAIISALLQLERAPIFTLQDRKDTEEGKITLFGTLEGLVKDLQSQAQDLVRSNGFYAYSLQVGDESVAAFTLSDGAAAGSHELKVFQLAAADRFTFDPVVDPDATGLGAGTITFDYDGTSYSVDVAAGEDSLNGIAAQINGDAGEALTASVINTGTASSPQYQLVVAGNDTGADFAVQNLTISGIGLTGLSKLTVAQNARVELDSLSIERSTNVFSDVLAGVSFTVNKASATGETTTFTIETDPEGVKANVQSFVDAYNAVIDFIEKQNSFSEEGGAGGDLFGDSALQSLRGAIQRAIFDVDLTTVQNDPDGYSTLGLVGVDVDADGRLSIDDLKFDEKLAQDLDQLAALFIDPGSGVLVKLDTAIEDLIKSQTAVDPMGNPVLNPVTMKEIVIQGLFDRRRSSISDVIDDIDDRIERIEYHVEQLEITLVQRFSNLESVLGGLNAQASYLSSGLGFPQQG